MNTCSLCGGLIAEFYPTFAVIPPLYLMATIIGICICVGLVWGWGR